MNKIFSRISIFVAAVLVLTAVVVPMNGINAKADVTVANESDNEIDMILSGTIEDDIVSSTNQWLVLTIDSAGADLGSHSIINGSNSVLGTSYIDCGVLYISRGSLTAGGIDASNVHTSFYNESTVINGDVTVGTLYVADGSTVTINGNLTTTYDGSDPSLYGTIYLNGTSTLIVNGTVTIADPVSTDSIDLSTFEFIHVDENATYTVNTPASATETAEEDDSVDAFREKIISIENEIANAQTLTATGENAVVTISENSGMTALPNSIMQCLVLNSDVSLVFEFEYNYEHYSVTIPAGMAIDDDTPWYGPLYLLEKFDAVTETTSNAVKTAAGATYTIQSGDCLSLIASDYNMTLGELLALNPQITNANLIYPGDVINMG